MASTRGRLTINPSLKKFIKSEITSNYFPEHYEDRYEFKREKIYSFLTVPREVEKFLGYGFFQVLDVFLFVFTFLPLRFVSAVGILVSQATFALMRRERRCARWLEPSQLMDVMKVVIIVINYHILSYLDTSRLYHVVKSQSIIKLYMFFNMLEVGDKLLSSFGQDTLDSLQWTAAELRVRKRYYLTPAPHLLLASVYVLLHCVLILLQVTVLNVAMNSNNKALLTVMMSNNFVELKGSVFKKFDKNNLLQVSCSDIRERFQLCILLFLVFIQTLKEFGWSEDQFWVLLPDGVLILLTEMFVDWVKHAFITRFNEIPLNVYSEYTRTLAQDLISSKRKLAFSDHSDMVSHRMGFISLPVAVLTARIVAQSVSVTRRSDWLLVALAYLALCSFRLLNTLLLLGKASSLLSAASAPQTGGEASAAAAATAAAAAATAAAPNGSRLSTPCMLRSRHVSDAPPAAAAAAAAGGGGGVCGSTDVSMPVLVQQQQSVSSQCCGMGTTQPPVTTSSAESTQLQSPIIERYNVFREFSTPSLGADSLVLKSSAAVPSCCSEAVVCDCSNAGLDCLTMADADLIDAASQLSSPKERRSSDTSRDGGDDVEQTLGTSIGVGLFLREDVDFVGLRSVVRSGASDVLCCPPISECSADCSRADGSNARLSTCGSPELKRPLSPPISPSTASVTTDQSLDGATF